MGYPSSSTSSSSSSTNNQPKKTSLHYKTIDALPNEYKLHIHFRSIGINQDGSRVSKSFGHFYVSLQGDPEGEQEGISKVIFIGKYPENGPCGPENIDSEKEAERHDLIKEFEKIHGKQYTLDKTFIITEDEYKKALDFITNKEEELYILWSKNCVDFVQQVYHATGLPLYFTFVYTECELESLKKKAAGYALKHYKCIDKFVSKFRKMHAASKEELVRKLNVDIECITQLPNGRFFVNIDQALLRIRDQQPSIDRNHILDARIDNIHSIVHDTAVCKSRRTCFNPIEKRRITRDIITKECRDKLSILFDEYCNDILRIVSDVFERPFILTLKHSTISDTAEEIAKRIKSSQCKKCNQPKTTSLHYQDGSKTSDSYGQFYLSLEGDLDGKQEGKSK